MTEFIHEPYKKVLVREIIKMSLDDLVSLIATLESASAYWAEGVLFVSFAITESDDLGKREIEGETYLDRVMFTRYDKYTKTARSSTNVEINVLNVQKSHLYRDLVVWLKKQPVWNE
ncbi:MAG: hypothetical protein QXE84_02205 [Candidatus Nitrosotenuis sp.]|uniref:Uncharacterized protein n=1 Tax=Candidatus Nitrosotenuis uzonensis TaxID=1407055 RepID=V6AS86_9ARCH|nr:hypothetical protein [Candidatus Nitrosotenuis uzonensis]CAE6500333.1 conserved hypothetical protein [Candidatus Nitrosotenuis uzonensis]CDI05512.1 conserved hypothetical protein [Candidatus Nitrosotenuis uzonensis]